MKPFLSVLCFFRSYVCSDRYIDVADIEIFIMAASLVLVHSYVRYVQTYLIVYYSILTV